MNETAKIKIPLKDRYELREKLGSGGAGTVFKAWDKQLNRFVAVKRLNCLDALFAPGNEQDEALWREAMTLAAIQHPNILTIHDFGLDDAGPYVITEFLPGASVDKAPECRRMAEQDFLDAASQTLEALIAAHHAGLIHRDIKPQNLFRSLLPSGACQYKILDFGLAKFIAKPTEQSMDNNRSICGSIYYIAPEQLCHEPLDARTDLYALGCVYYYMLSGQAPFNGDTIPELINSHLQHTVVPLGELCPDITPALCNWIMKMISLSPDDRFPSAVDALRALQAFAPLKGGTGGIRLPRPATRTIRLVSVRNAQQADGGMALPLKSGAIRAARRPADSKPIVMPSGSVPAKTRHIPPAGGTESELLRQSTALVPVAEKTFRMARWAFFSGIGTLLLAMLALGSFFVLHRRASEQPPPEASQVASVASGQPASRTHTRRTTARVEVTAEDEVLPPDNLPDERLEYIESSFESIKNIPFYNWGNIGSVMEALAYLQLREQFPPPPPTMS